MPALAPLCLSLVGVAGVYRRGRLADYALAGAALGVACATKYTAGHRRCCACVGRRRRRAWTRVARARRSQARCAVGRLRRREPVRGARPGRRSATGWPSSRRRPSDGGGKLGLVGDSGHLYYLATLTWGLGWLPALAAAGGRRRAVR